jgi:lipopolysaccharide export system protein LptC
MPKINYIIKHFLNLLLEPVIGHSRVVSVTKIALLSAAFILIAALIILPITSRVNKNFRLTFSTVEKGTSVAAPTMINPHLQGVDNNNQTYNISAKTATQDKAERMSLKAINADITLKGGGWISLTAEEGGVDRVTNMLDLKGNINIFNQDGYEFNTNEAHADMKNNFLYGNTKITGQGPLGNISGDSFSVEDKGASIKLKGNVKLILFPR